MEFREDPPAFVIDEIAALLAAGYLRLRKARILDESSDPPTPQVTTDKLHYCARPEPL